VKQPLDLALGRFREGVVAMIGRERSGDVRD
jgi:hypothetical protein